MSNQRAVIVNDTGSSWLLAGDPDEETYPYEEGENGDGCQHALAALLNEGWSVSSVNGGSGSKDDAAYWLVILKKD